MPAHAKYSHLETNLAKTKIMQPRNRKDRALACPPYGSRTSPRWDGLLAPLHLGRGWALPAWTVRKDEQIKLVLSLQGKLSPQGTPRTYASPNVEGIKGTFFALSAPDQCPPK